MIEVNKLSLRLGTKQILDNVSFNLSDQRNLAIIGRSGSGKTMLIKTMLGIFKPDTGAVTIDGVNIYHDSKEERKKVLDGISMVFQNAALLDSLSVQQNIALPLYERAVFDVKTIDRKVEECLSIVGLSHSKSMYPSELSGGMRKRIGIARALVYQPKYIVFDEPISGLDPITASEIMYYIAKISSERRATTITITHHIRDIQSIADTVLFIDDGSVVYFGSPSGLLESPNEFISKFITL